MKSGSETFRGVAESINAEGWDSDAAVVIGKPEDVERQTGKLLNKEGGYTDLDSYISACAESFASKSELEETSCKDNLVPGIYTLIYLENPENDKTTQLLDLYLVFVSRDGTLKKLNFSPKSLKKVGGVDPIFLEQFPKDWKKINTAVQKQLEEFEFINSGSDVVADALKQIDQARSKKIKEEKTAKGFRF